MPHGYICVFKHVINMSEYKIPSQTRIGHIHLKVSDLQKSLDFYCGLLGFDKMMLYGDQAAFISAGGYHHHIGLNTWHSKGASPAPEYAQVCTIPQSFTPPVKIWPWRLKCCLMQATR